MKAKFVVPTLLLAGMAAFGNAAMASDELAGALIGAGSGAVIGHAIGGRDAAVVGGFLGALVGAAVADDAGRPVLAQPRYRPVYGPPVVYEAPRVRYVAAPVFVETRPAPYVWRNQWQERRDGRWDHGHDRWNDRHDGRREW
jgi:hypothetical protein